MAKQTAESLRQQELLMEEKGFEVCPRCNDTYTKYPICPLCQRKDK